MTEKGIVQEGLDSLSRIRLQGIALLTVAFLSGVLSGVVAERLRAARARPLGPRPVIRFGVRLPPGGLPPNFEALDLSGEQRQRIENILSQRRPRADSVLRAMLPRLRGAADSARDAIRAVLTPEQQARLDSLEASVPFGGWLGAPGRILRDAPDHPRPGPIP